MLITPCNYNILSKEDEILFILRTLFQSETFRYNLSLLNASSRVFKSYIIHDNHPISRL